MVKRLLALLVCQLVAVSLFCAGFFPQKKVLKGDAEFLIEPDLQREAKPVFSKFVLVVIDALRSDFVFEKSKSHFSYVHSLLEQGNAWGFTAFSNPPTVTLPRLKGITTGSTPNFLDAILNVAEDDSSSNLKEQDSWVKQFINHGKRVRFFGDDTWLKLFPLHFFDEYEGTNSFFVSDFEQVDLNVTRHVPHQLQNQDDWDALILHYLGLDHIGHKGGSGSQFMPGKHEEMDAIIKQIYENSDDDTLICVMGDHGMNDNGNHGGSSAGETSAALVFMSKKLQDYEVPAEQKSVHLPVEDTSTAPNYQYLTSIQQVDLVPTLAALFNFPIPKNSVGVLIRDTLQLLDDKLAAVKVQENFQQLQLRNGHDGKEECLGDFDVTFQKMRDIQSELARSATDYNYNFLSIGFIFLLVSTVATTAVGFKQMKLEKPFFLIFTVSLLVGVSSFGSSFVEEEHQIWWWVSTGAVLLSSLHVPDKKLIHLMIIISLRIIRGWNNSGQKTLYDNTLFEILKRNPIQQWYLNFITIFSLGLLQSDILSFLSTFLVTMLCFVYKVSWAIVNRETVPDWMNHVAFESCSLITGSATSDAFEESLVPLGQLFYKCFVACIVINVVSAKLNSSKKHVLDSICTPLTMLLIFQSSSPNIPMFLAFNVLRKSLTTLLVEDYDSNCFITSITSLVLQYFTFFHFGGTNSIATVDLSNAYHGVSENYNIYAVGFMMCFSNFVPSIYWSTFTWRILYNGKQTWRSFSRNKLTFLLFNCVSGCFLLLACVVLRFHLFIWSVFSPKLCYYATWNIFMNLIIGWILEVPVALMS